MSNTRNAALSRTRIMKEAEREFSEKGFDGASVNVIAEAAEINKRMIYHYFGSKEGLYRAILRANYEKILALEAQVVDGNQDVCSCIGEMIGQYYHFLWHNPIYIRLMSWENLQEDKIAKDVLMETLLVGMDKIECIYQKGIAEGVLRPGLDLQQTLLSINGLCYMTFSRLDLLSALWGDLLTEKLEQRLAHICDLVLSGIGLQQHE